MVVLMETVVRFTMSKVSSSAKEMPPSKSSRCLDAEGNVDMGKQMVPKVFAVKVSGLKA